jgi:PAS domain S-box-containing protein
VTGRDKLKVLFVEDLPSDVELAERALRRSGLDVEYRRVETREAYAEALSAFDPDIIVSDYSMPRFDGMSALRMARERSLYMPFIVLTGSMNEDTAVECMKAGASDYVIKEHLARLPFAVREAINRRDLALADAIKSGQLRESENRYRSIFEESHAVMIIVDPETRTVVEANQTACEFYGWAKGEMAGKDIGEISTLGSEELERELEPTIAKKRNRFTFKHRKADGTLIDVDTFSGPLLLGGRKLLFSIIHDISDRVTAENARDEMSSKLKHYLATSPTVTYSFRIMEGKINIQWISENIRDVLGYTLEEAMEAGWWPRNVHSSDRMRALGGISLLSSKGSFAQDYRFLKKNREVIWIHDEMRLGLSDKDGTEIVGTYTDVTDRKKVEAELSLKSIALEAAANAIVITDRGGTIQWVNPAFERLTGFPPAEAIGKNLRDLIKSGEHDKAFYLSLWDTILSGRVWQGEIVNRKKGGELYTEEMTITPVLDEAHGISGFIAIKSDVSERERSRKRLEASLAEKEVLLREIHHRIKNNMQLIISLMSISSQETRDSSLQQYVAGISRRLSSMALVHEQFYDSPDMNRIDFLPYLQQLADSLRADSARPIGKVTISADAMAIDMNLETAVPAGLVAAELITNAFSHAYPAPAEPGEVRIELKRSGKEIELSIRDWGCGLPEGFDPLKADSIGMILVCNLAAQLGGKLEFRRKGGTEAILRFPIDSHNK